MVSADVTPPRRVPQWVFLRSFFGNVLLSDDAALAASAVSVKPNWVRRILLGTAAAICVFLSVAFIVSFVLNHKLETAAHGAAAAIAARDVSAVVPALPSLDELTRLDALRQTVQVISHYNRDGAPLKYRWGLYVGDELYPKVRRLYFERFWQLLFGSTQLGLMSNLQGLPAAPSPTDSYQYPYDSLKAYLITTSNHDKSTVAYLSPLLYARWEAQKGVDLERAKLVRGSSTFIATSLSTRTLFLPRTTLLS